MKNRKLFTSILSLVLVISILFSQFAFKSMTLNASAEGESASAEEIIAWSGNAATSFAGGDGTAASPFLIENADQLYKMVVDYHTYEASKGKYFKITKDIYINDVSDGTSIVDLYNKKNWLYAYGDTIAAASKANSFNGTLDGNGYTIYGLYATSADKVSLGLFPAISSYAVIKNLSFDNLLIAGGNGYGGAIAGRAIYYAWQSAAQITNCSVTNATIGQWGNLEMAGGFLGDIGDCSVNFTNCGSYDISLSNWESSGTPGGIVGNAYSSGTLKLTNCYSVGHFPTNSKVSKATCADVYTDIAIPEGNTTAGVTVLESAQMKGEAAKENMSSLDFKWTWEISENGYPVLKSDIIEVWDGTVASGVSDYKGSGTAADPYLIENGAQLAAATVKVNAVANSKYYFKLVKDIRLNDTTNENWKDSARNWVWADVRFQGNFDGNGHTIDGFYYSGSQYRMGLFAYVGDSTIYNFKMTNAYVNDTNSETGLAFVAGQASAAVTFDKIYIDDTCYINAPNSSGVAGILGRCNGSVTITNSAVNATIIGKSGSTPAAFIGVHNSGTHNHSINSSYTASNLPLIGSGSLTNSAGNYSLVADSYGTTVLTADQMRGDNAVKYMPTLSFKYVWETVENGYPILNPRGNLWDGTWVTSFDSFEGSGTEDDPYLIENGAQLAFAVAKSGTALAEAKHYKLTKDIVLNDTSYEGWEASARSWVQNTSYRFNGELDGDGHTIEGLYWNATSGGRYGLFAYTGKLASGDTHVATVKNITFKGASVSNSAAASDATQGAAIVAGQASGETVFENIFIDETSKVNAPNIKGVAGLVGRGYNQGSKAHITIKNCAVNASVTGGSAVGAFTGTFWDTTVIISISNSYSSSGIALVGGNSGTTTVTNSYGLVEDSYGTNVLASAGLMKGENAVTNMTGLHFGRHWKVVENGYPVPMAYNAPKDVWDGTVATSFDGFKGSGTATDPYQIENGSQLAYVVSTDLKDGLYYKLVNDIKLNDTSDAQWTKSANVWVWGNIRFVGDFEGNGHTVDGLYYKGSQSKFGLFSYVGDSNIRNIKITNAYITSTASNGVGILAGQTSANTTFEKIYIDDTCTVNAPNTTGVAGITSYGNGSTTATIKDSAVLATLIGGSQIGAFAGGYWNNDKVIIINSFSAVEGAKLSGNSGLSNSYNNYGLVADDYNTVVLTVAQMKGITAQENMSALDFYCVWEAVQNDFPAIKKNPLAAWDGSVAESLKGEGTKANPYKISNGAELYYAISTYSNQNYTTLSENIPYFEITADINLGNIQWYNVGKTAYPNSSNYATGFAGVIYGKGHTIYNLSNTASVAVAGLIPVATQGTEIYDLHLKAGNVPKTVWNDYTNGGLIGLAVATAYSKPIVISGCSVENYTIGSRDGSGAFVGDTYSQSLIIKDCYALNNDISHTSTTATMNSGAFVGIVDGNGEGNSIVIENSYCDTSAKIGYVKDMATSFNNVYTIDADYDDSIDGLGKLTAAQITGDTAKENLLGFNFNQMWQTVDGAYPVHKSMEDRATAWDGTIATGFADGDGTAEEPYLISNASELYLLASLDRTATYGKYFKLANDITISNVYENWENDRPYSWISKKVYLDGFGYSSSFAGVLDGANHTISGLYIEDTVSEEGTFAYGILPFVTAEAIIKNLNVENVNMSVEGNAYVGAVAGLAHVSTEDMAVTLKHIYFLDVNVENGAILGGATRGVSFNRCEGETLDTNSERSIFNIDTNKGLTFESDALIYTTQNVDEELLSNVRKALLKNDSIDCVDINGVEGFNITDLVAVNEALTYVTPEESLVWSQEFNGDSLDYSVWSRNTTMSKGTTIEYADNNTVNGGSLKLYCEDTGNTDVNDNKIYSVNYGLDTINSMSFKYGRLEMRAKIPFYDGAFPSLWLTSRNAIGYNPLSTYSTEIDIFEVFGNGAFDLGELTSNNYQMVTCIHKWYNDVNGNKTDAECSCGTSSDAGNNYIVAESDRSKTFKSSSEREAWHDIVFEWTEDAMTFSVDGNVYYTADRNEMEGNFGITGEDYTVDGLFEQFLCLRLNNHMHTNGGAYSYKGTGTIDASKLNYEIDYIRLYQKNDGKSQINLK